MFFLFSSLCLADAWRGIKRPLSEEAKLGTFAQIIDHDSATVEYFDQRYYNNSKYADSPIKNVILEIGGESDSFGAGGSGDFLEVLAKDLKAPVFTLEHRFFGQSFPASSSTENYAKLLTTHQALEDLAYFAEEMKKKDEYKNTKWLITGGSYPGMMAAVARQNYSKTFHAALSSSGVVLASDNYTDFDLQIAISLGQECASAARQTRLEIEKLELEKNPETWDWLQKEFAAYDLPLEDFWFVIGELFTIAPQYGYRDRLCGPLVDAVKTKGDLIMALANFSRGFFVPVFCDNNMSSTYSRKYMKDVAGQTSGVASRSWMWMCCNEVAYWQVSPGRLSLRPKALDQEYFKQQCTDIFGAEHSTPNVAKFNADYLGLKQVGTRVFFSTGSQDPWTWTCVTEDSGVIDGQVAHTITGNEMGHCTDLHGAKDSDPPDLKRTREYERALFKKWMAED